MLESHCLRRQLRPETRTALVFGELGESGGLGGEQSEDVWLVEWAQLEGWEMDRKLK